VLTSLIAYNYYIIIRFLDSKRCSYRKNFVFFFVVNLFPLEIILPILFIFLLLIKIGDYVIKAPTWIEKKVLNNEINTLKILKISPLEQFLDTPLGIDMCVNYQNNNCIPLSQKQTFDCLKNNAASGLCMWVFSKLSAIMYRCSVNFDELNSVPVSVELELLVNESDGLLSVMENTHNDHLMSLKRDLDKIFRKQNALSYVFFLAIIKCFDNVTKILLNPALFNV